MALIVGQREDRLDCAISPRYTAKTVTSPELMGKVMLRRRTEPDLILIDVLTLALVLIVFAFPVTWLRIVLGIPSIGLFPGYVLIAVLFPRREPLSAVERIALSLGLSIAVMVLIGLVLDYTPWGIGLYPILLSVSSFILLMSGLAWYTRGRVCPEERLSVDLRLPLAGLTHSWGAAGKLYHALTIFLLLAILGGSALGYVLTTPRAGQEFTEFYILGPEGKAENYPHQLRAGQEGRVMAGIVNHEQEEVDYRLQVMVDGDKLSELGPISLKPGERWEGVARFTPTKIGDSQKVEFLLYEGGQPCEIRYLWVDVRT